MKREFDKHMTVAYFSSDAWAELCGVSLTSLFENNKEFDAIDVYIVEDAITAENKARFEQLAKKYQRSVQMIPMPEPESFFGDSRFSFKSLGRTFAHMIVGQLLPPEVDRVLVLDSDTLILDSLMELWNTDLTDYYVAGVDTGTGKESLEILLKIKAGTLYCNGGLFLMNLRRIREDNIEEKYKAFIKKVFDEGHSLVAYEEEVINKCCSPHILRLDPRYNLMSINLVMTYEEFVKFRGTVNYYSKEEMQAAIEHPAIIHAINTFYVKKRIWEKNSDSPYADVYLEYRKKTPWGSLPQIEIERTLKQKAMKEVWHLMPRKLSFFLASIARNRIRPRLAKKRDDE